MSKNSSRKSTTGRESSSRRSRRFHDKEQFDLSTQAYSEDLYDDEMDTIFDFTRSHFNDINDGSEY